MRGVALRAQIWVQLIFVCVCNNFVARQVWSWQKIQKGGVGGEGVNRSPQRLKPWMNCDCLIIWSTCEPPRCWVCVHRIPQSLQTRPWAANVQTPQPEAAGVTWHQRGGGRDVCSQLIHSCNMGIVKATRCLGSNWQHAGCGLCEMRSHTGAESEEEALIYRGTNCHRFQKVLYQTPLVVSREPCASRLAVIFVLFFPRILIVTFSLYSWE